MEAKVIVIAGAGTGLGLARRFAADGESVVLLGRNLAKVEAINNAVFYPPRGALRQLVLPTYLPTRYCIVEGLPHSASMKVARAAVRALFD